MVEWKKILVPRITQLDANEFDREIHKILFNQVIQISNAYKPGILDKVKDELTLLLNLIIFKYSLLQNRATVGQDLLGLKYDDTLTKTKAILFAVIKFVFPYLRNKCEFNQTVHNNVLIPDLLRKIDIIVKAGHLLNLFIFLTDGKYPTVTDRLLKLKYVATEKYSRTVGYNFMVRQLLWHGFMELLTQALPLINYKAIKRKIKMFFTPSSNKIKIKTYAIHNETTKCVICDDFPVLPCIISTYCPHVACYYCLKSNLMADDKFLCPECNEINTVGDDIKFL